MTHIAAVLDLDGLLFDTERVYAKATEHAMAELGLNADPGFCRSLAGHPADVCERWIFDRFGSRCDHEALAAAYSRHKEELLRDGIPLKPSASEFLHALRGAERAIALATSASANTVVRYLEDACLSRAFDVIVTRNDVCRGKPDPATHLLAAARLDLPITACVAFEDSEPGILAALAAGLATVYIPDLAAVDHDTADRCLRLPDLAQAITHIPSIFLNAASKEIQIV